MKLLSSPSSPYESPSSGWKFHFSPTSYAALAAALFPSSLPGSQDLSSATASNLDDQCE